MNNIIVILNIVGMVVLASALIYLLISFHRLNKSLNAPRVTVTTNGPMTAEQATRPGVEIMQTQKTGVVYLDGEHEARLQKFLDEKTN